MAWLEDAIAATVVLDCYHLLTLDHPNNKQIHPYDYTWLHIYIHIYIYTLYNDMCHIIYNPYIYAKNELEAPMTVGEVLDPSGESCKCDACDGQGVAIQAAAAVFPNL